MPLLKIGATIFDNKNDPTGMKEARATRPDGVLISSCLGCAAHEFGFDRRFAHDDFCRLRCKTRILRRSVVGFYGQDKQIIDCWCAPAEKCPKPRTQHQFVLEMRKRGTV